MRGIFSPFLDVVRKTLVGGIFHLNLISAVDLKHSASLITSTPNKVVWFLGLYRKSFANSSSSFKDLLITNSTSVDPGTNTTGSPNSMN